jgi:PHD/YefM family antitoxin component YafN of YafNO toxin-antitoxin module
VVGEGSDQTPSFLLDTNIVIAVLSQEDSALARLQDAADGLYKNMYNYLTTTRMILTGRLLETVISAWRRGAEGMLKLPEVLGVAEARSELPRVLEDVEKGRTFIIKGPKGREAFVLNADVFRRLQDAYLEVVGELETIRILDDEAAVRAIRESSDEDRRELSTLSEVENLVGEVDEDDGYART